MSSSNEQYVRMYIQVYCISALYTHTFGVRIYCIFECYTIHILVQYISYITHNVFEDLSSCLFIKYKIIFILIQVEYIPYSI